MTNLLLPYLRGFIVYVLIVFIPFMLNSCGGNDGISEENKEEEDYEEEGEKPEEVVEENKEVEEKPKEELPIKETPPPPPVEVPNNNRVKGFFYTIQIAARHTMHGGLNYKEVKNIMKENIVTEQGWDKLRIGHYKTLEEAKKAEAVFKKAGVKSTWIVPLLNGNRITYKEALEYEKIQPINL